MATRFETEMWTTDCIIDFRGMPSTLVIILIMHQQHAFPKKKTLAKEGILNLGRNERSSTRRIYLVVPVLRSNYNTVLADVVSLVANNQDFARRNASERLVLVGIAKGDNCTSLATITTNRYEKKETYQQKPSPPAPHSISASQYAQAAHPGCNPTPQSSCWGTASPPD
jgi:hypothetical protein